MAQVTEPVDVVLSLSCDPDKAYLLTGTAGQLVLVGHPTVGTSRLLEMLPALMADRAEKFGEVGE